LGVWGGEGNITAEEEEEYDGELCLSLQALRGAGGSHLASRGREQPEGRGRGDGGRARRGGCVEYMRGSGERRLLDS
jgi:hypothetical protein